MYQGWPTWKDARFATDHGITDHSICDRGSGIERSKKAPIIGGSFVGGMIFAGFAGYLMALRSFGLPD